MERLLIFIKENIRLLLGLGVVILLIAVFITILLNRKPTQVVLGDQSFKVYVARTDEQKQTGLSETKTLSQNQGMLFLFDNPGFYSFWMKDMDFPIDIIYINGEKVTTVVQNAKAPTSPTDNLEIYKPEEKSDKVLEINAGLSQKYNIKKGTTVKVENL